MRLKGLRVYGVSYADIPASCLPDPGSLIVAIDPDGKLPIPEPWLVATFTRDGLIQHAVFWRKELAITFAEAMLEKGFTT